MDEPTSSLDIRTQKQLFDNLQSLKDLTCIAYPPGETKYFFNKILEINNQHLSETNNYLNKPQIMSFECFEEDDFFNL